MRVATQQMSVERFYFLLARFSMASSMVMRDIEKVISGGAK